MRTQIAVRKTSNRLIEAMDCLDPRPELHKIRFCIQEYDRGGGEGSGKGSVCHWVDAVDFKAIARAVERLALSPSGPSDPTRARERDLPASGEVRGQGTGREVWTDMKGTPRDGALEARIFMIRHVPSKNCPWEIVIKNGAGSAIGAGAVKMDKVTASATFSFSHFEFVAFCGEILDYIRDWEVRHFAQIVTARTSVPATCDPGARQRRAV